MIATQRQCLYSLFYWRSYSECNHVADSWNQTGTSTRYGTVDLYGKGGDNFYFALFSDRSAHHWDIFFSSILIIGIEKIELIN